MNFLIKAIDFKNNIFYATPEDPQGLRHLSARDKAEIFKMKNQALKTIVSMKQTPEMRNYVFHIEGIDSN